ncbi:membrane-spanning 4-domains subfamily A member 4D-like [Watersipora subatra]|uniref:membrane-spanning 4-domains subfamily A member 4D-like n=1 Tax=Watersipora subatra TaxID=2589382 RepID=UPI00355C3911
MARRTGVDTAVLVAGILMLILTLSLCGTSIATLGLTYLEVEASVFQLVAGGWYFLTSVLAIAAGASGHKCPYVSSIVITIFAILISLGATIVAAFVAFGDLFSKHSNIIFGPSTILPDFHLNVYLGRDTEEILSSLPVGVFIINGISFILLIVLSALSCSGTCCNSPRTFHPPQQFAVTTGGYAPVPVPPAYVSQYPPPPQDINGLANPTYDMAPGSVVRSQ